MSSDLRSRVQQLSWYHTFELPGGIVTEGMFDHRSMVGRLPIPRSLAGLRCLDVASSDGFFAFEMARRGASEVVSLDLPDHGAQDYWTPGSDGPGRSTARGRANTCFELVAEATGLAVKRVDGSVYDIDVVTVGRFDFVFMGNILLHLRDPLAALDRVARVTSGILLSLEPVSMPLSILRPMTPCGQFSIDDPNRFWIPNLAGHQRLLRAAGLQVIDHCGPVFQRLGRQWPSWPQRFPTRPRELLFWTLTRQFGGACGWCLAVPGNTGPGTAASR
jgi:tRNA (mo5U34)-methyltransferase